MVDNDRVEVNCPECSHVVKVLYEVETECPSCHRNVFMSDNEIVSVKKKYLIEKGTQIIILSLCLVIYLLNNINPLLIDPDFVSIGIVIVIIIEMVSGLRRGIFTFRHYYGGRSISREITPFYFWAILFLGILIILTYIYVEYYYVSPSDIPFDFNSKYLQY